MFIINDTFTVDAPFLAKKSQCAAETPLLA